MLQCGVAQIQGVCGVPSGQLGCAQRDWRESLFARVVHALGHSILGYRYLFMKVWYTERRNGT